jgi:hypothetical protein
MGQLGRAATGGGGSVKTITARLAILLVLLTAYVGVWRPLRTVTTTQLAQPVLAPGAEIKNGVYFTMQAGEYSARYTAPAGGLWLLPAIVFVLIGRWRPIGWLLAGHLVIGLIAFGCLLVGVGRVDWLLLAGDFLGNDLTRVGSMAYLVLVWVRHVDLRGAADLVFPKREQPDANADQSDNRVLEAKKEDVVN